MTQPSAYIQKLIKKHKSLAKKAIFMRSEATALVKRAIAILGVPALHKSSALRFESFRRVPSADGYILTVALQRTLIETSQIVPDDHQRADLAALRSDVIRHFASEEQINDFLIDPWVVAIVSDPVAR